MEEGDDLGPLSIWILKLLLASIWGLPPSLACGMEIGRGERGGGGEVAGDGARRRLWVGFGVGQKELRSEERRVGKECSW